MQSRPLTSQPTSTPRFNFSINQPLAAVIWLLACITSWQMIAAVTDGMDGRYQIGIGVALQVIFTALERPILSGRPNRVSGIVLLIDTLINAGGIFPFALRTSATPTVQMVSTTFGIAPTISPIAAFLLSLLAGFLLAAAPEAVWRWRD